MRYRVKDSSGRELTVPSLPDLDKLYRQGFLKDEDLVRPESATRWTRAGDMPALAGTRRRQRTDPRWAALVLAAALAVALAVALLLRAR